MSVSDIFYTRIVSRSGGGGGAATQSEVKGEPDILAFARTSAKAAVPSGSVQTQK